MENITIILGWKEWVALPDLSVPAIKAKVDTGALTSSLHAYNIQYFKDKGKNYVRFTIHPLQNNKKITILCEALLIGERKVKSSNGKIQKRPVISTNLQIGRHIIPIEVNLTNRDPMGVKMLIGRKALKKMLINASHTFLHGKISTKESTKLYGK